MTQARRLFMKGDVVEILREYQDEGDDQFIWIAISNEEKGRVDISPSDISMNCPPIYTVESSWLKLKS